MVGHQTPDMNPGQLDLDKETVVIKVRTFQKLPRLCTVSRAGAKPEGGKDWTKINKEHKGRWDKRIEYMIGT